MGAPIRHRKARHRRYLMCPPTHFTVSYEINPWMNSGVPVDAGVAMAQWERLRQVYLDLGHQVDVIEPLPDCPDMVYAANGATVIDGICYSARFHYPERQPEGPAYEAWFAANGFTTVTAHLTNEGEGDLLCTPRLILAGTGFRTDQAAHLEAQEAFGRPVISLRLVDPRFYHLDTALTVLGDDLVAYHPEAFSPGSQAVLARLFPDAIEVGADDAGALGLNAVSDGANVILAPDATGYAEQLRERGFTPIPVDTSELLKGGGGAKCCTLEIREAPVD